MYPFRVIYISRSNLASSSHKIHNTLNITMSAFSPTSTNLMFSLRVLTISSSLCFLAILLKLSLSQLTTLTLSNDLSSIFNLLSSCLKPPYLYLVINFIIITIVATSKLQSKFDHYAFSQPPPPPVINKIDDYLVNTVVTDPLFDYGYVPDKVLEREDVNNVIGSVVESKEKPGVAKDCDVKVMNLTSSNKVISRAPAVALLTEFSKPPVSSRFGHRKVIKTTADHQGGKTLKVSKPKRNETLESTWKTITDGRPMPLTRHLRKSDTWENHPAHTTNPLDFDQDHNMMTKSETFNDRTIRKKNSSTLSRSSGPGKLKKDPSLSQDELNKRVEAFITKFNEDMRLQRQESLNQYMEMINRGAGP